MIKVINPLGYILAGFLLEFVNPYLIPLISGVIFTILLLLKTVTTQEKTLEKAA